MAYFTISIFKKQDKNTCAKYLTVPVYQLETELYVTHIYKYICKDGANVVGKVNRYGLLGDSCTDELVIL